jgi:hypothetical protein
MAKKRVGYVKLIWTCPRCSTRNPGPNKFCNGCGAPQPAEVQFEQPAEAELIRDAEELKRAKAAPDIHCPYCGGRNPAGVKFCGACGGDLSEGKARAKGQVVGAYRAPSGATRPCPACGTANPLTSVKCSNCGAALPAPEAPAEPPRRPLRASKTPLIAGGIVAAVSVLAVCVFAGLSLRRQDRPAVVNTVAWERTIEIEQFGPVEREDWRDSVPADATSLSCDLQYRGSSSDPAPIATEVCGTPYTIDEGTGYGQVVQDCEYRVYDERCTYTVNEWSVARTERASGDDLTPVWPAVQLAGDSERRGAQDETYRVILVSDGETFTYVPETASEFGRFGPGSEWTVTVNGLGAIVAIEPAP